MSVVFDEALKDRWKILLRVVEVSFCKWPEKHESCMRKNKYDLVLDIRGLE